MRKRIECGAGSEPWAAANSWRRSNAIVNRLPEVSELWSRPRDLFITALTAVLEPTAFSQHRTRSNVGDGTRPINWMIDGPSASQSPEICKDISTEHIWLVSAGLLRLIHLAWLVGMRRYVD